MSMSTHLKGFRPIDDRWRAMKTAWDACKAISADPPQAVSDFFGDEEPDEGGIAIDLERSPCVSQWSREMEDGYVVDLRRLPEGITHLRFYNSF